MTKVTPTVTNVKRANIDQQHKDLMQSVKDSDRHTVKDLQKHADNIYNIHLYAAENCCSTHITGTAMC